MKKTGKHASKTGERKYAAVQLEQALSGTGAHVAPENVFAEMDWKQAGMKTAGVAHSVYQLLNHIRFWQDWAVAWGKDQSPPVPKHAAGSWPGEVGPASKKEWDAAVRQFARSLRELRSHATKGDLTAKHGAKTVEQMLHAIASHNSYHLGQVVILRQMAGQWLPPSGGLTW
jgi:hypothetical protein